MYQVEVKINFYIALVISSVRNLSMLMARALSEKVTPDQPLTDGELSSLKITTDFYNQ